MGIRSSSEKLMHSLKKNVLAYVFFKTLIVFALAIRINHDVWRVFFGVRGWNLSCHILEPISVHSAQLAEKVYRTVFRIRHVPFSLFHPFPRRKIQILDYFSPANERKKNATRYKCEFTRVNFFNFHALNNISNHRWNIHHHRIPPSSRHKLATLTVKFPQL